MMALIFSVAMALGVSAAGWFFSEMVFYLLASVSVSVMIFTSVEFAGESGQVTDFLSSFLIVLSFLVGGLMLSGSWGVKIWGKNKSVYVFVCSLMILILVITFKVSNLLYFYIFFEAGLIPIFLLVLGWGYQPERLQAGVYMLFYTLFASLPLLVVILLRWEYFNEMLVFFSGPLSVAGAFDWLLVGAYVLAFLVKLPMFCFHLWLPKAHVEAPVAGSMILAGVLLKLGSYGLWRVLSSIFLFFSLTLSEFLAVMGLVGGLLMAFVCLVQVDMKALVACSSVVHMGLLLAGMSTVYVAGYLGALCMMVGHGVVSSGLFYLVGCSFDRSGSRSLLVGKGLMMLFPALTIFWFILSIFNFSAPPSVNLLGEIFLTASLLKWGAMTFIFLILMNFMGMAYGFYLYSFSQHGKSASGLVSSCNVFTREYVVSMVHSLVVGAMVLCFWLF